MPERRDWDSGDLDALGDIDESLGYRIVSTRMFEELTRRQFELESDLSERQTQFVRGYIAALKMALTLPDNLISEIKAILGAH